MSWTVRIVSGLVIAAFAIWIGGEIRDWFDLRRQADALDAGDAAERDRAAVLLLERLRAGRLPEWATARLIDAVVSVETVVEPGSPAAGEPVVFRCRVRTEYPLPLSISCRGIVEIDGQPALELSADNVVPPDAPRPVYEAVSAPTPAFPQAGRFTVRVTLSPSRAERERLGNTVWSRPIRGPQMEVTVRP